MLQYLWIVLEHGGFFWLMNHVSFGNAFNTISQSLESEEVTGLKTIQPFNSNHNILIYFYV